MRTEPKPPNKIKMAYCSTRDGYIKPFWPDATLMCVRQGDRQGITDGRLYTVEEIFHYGYVWYIRVKGSSGVYDIDRFRFQ